jgi:hypothetical protein
MWWTGAVCAAAALFAVWACVGPGNTARVRPALALPSPDAGVRPPACRDLHTARRLWVGSFEGVDLREIEDTARRARSIIDWLDGRCRPEGAHLFDRKRRETDGLRVTRIDFCDMRLNRARVTAAASDAESGAIAFWVSAAMEADAGDGPGFRLGSAVEVPAGAIDPRPEPPPAGCAGP